MTFKLLKDAIEKAEIEFGAKNSDFVHIDVWETLRIVGSHKDILIDVNSESGELIYFVD